MKKTILSIITAAVLSTSLAAKSIYTNEYQMHSNVYNQTFDIKNASTKEVFFGTKQEYFEEVAEGLKAIQNKGLDAAIEGGLNQSANIAKGFLEYAGKGVALSAAIGGIIGLIDSYIKESKKSDEYMYVVEFTDKNGESTTGSVLLSTQAFKENPDLTKIKNIMKGGF